MNAQDVVDELMKLTPEQRKEMIVFYRSYGLTHDIKEVERVTQDTYGFFGIRIPCIILDDVIEDEEDEEEDLKYVCADCGHETDQENGPCAKCHGYRIVLISVAEQLFGPDWRSAFDSPKQ